ncbi:MAG: hypothetical protein CFH44_00843 [Proteobacteria bacterium]|nr:MAG: hypothetical protein CFH44_00843 [Pseudomonadota bacterium]
MSFLKKRGNIKSPPWMKSNPRKNTFAGQLVAVFLCALIGLLIYY